MHVYSSQTGGNSQCPIKCSCWRPHDEEIIIQIVSYFGQNLMLKVPFMFLVTQMIFYVIFNWLGFLFNDAVHI